MQNLPSTFPWAFSVLLNSLAFWDVQTERLCQIELFVCLFVSLFVCLFAPLMLLPIKVWQVFSVEGFPLYHCQWQRMKLFALNVRGTSHKNFLSESVMVSFPSSLVGFLGFHPYMLRWRPGNEATASMLTIDTMDLACSEGKVPNF